MGREQLRRREVDERSTSITIRQYGGYNWELFFHIPLLIATRLTQNQRYAEARHWFHYIFDPTADRAARQRSAFWKIKPFYQEQLKGPQTRCRSCSTIDERITALEQQVAAWEQRSVPSPTRSPGCGSRPTCRRPS